MCLGNFKFRGSHQGWKCRELKCVLDPKLLVCPLRYALCGKRLNSATMVSAIMSLIDDDFVDLNDLFRYLIPRLGVRIVCRI